MSPGEIALAVGAVTASALVATGLGSLAWTGRRLVSKFDAMDKAVRGNGADHPGLGEQIRGVHTEVRLVRGEFKEHAEGEPARIRSEVRKMDEPRARTYADMVND